MKTAVRLAAALLLTASPALAAGFTPPEGCTVYMTVQARECRVSNHYKCEADAPGDQWRADSDQEGVFFLSRIDDEAQWVESIDLNPVSNQFLDPGPNDPASFSGLLATGLDRFDFTLSKDDGTSSRVVGYDRLTGQSRVIDGVTLLETEYQYVETGDDGNVIAKAHGREFISEDYRTFFSGPSEWFDGTQWLPMDGSPMQFIFPGEKGFSATQPIFGCDEVISALPQSPIPHS